MSSHFYPNLINRYQTPGKAAKIARMHDKGPGEFYWYSKHSHSLDFYYHGMVPRVPSMFKSLDKGDWVYTDHVGRAYIEECNLPFRKAYILPHYSVTILKIPFLI